MKNIIMEEVRKYMKMVYHMKVIGLMVLEKVMEH